jgi:ABC-2 type transport system permease protein
MSIVAGFRAEVDRLGHNRLDLALLTVVPAVMLALMAAMLFAGSPRGLGVVVVDRDGGPLARAIVRDLAASPQLRVVAVTGQIGQGLSALRQERAVAVVVVPRGVATGLRRPGAAPVEVLYAAQFLATGAVAQTSAELAVASALAAGRRRGWGSIRRACRGPCRAARQSHRQPGMVSGPAAGAWHSPSGDRRYCHRRADAPVAGWLFRRVCPRDAGRGRAVVGRLLPHVGAGTALATAWLLWLVLARGYRVEGSVLALVGGYALLFAATVSIALFLLALVREPATALSGAVIVAGSALAYSGASLPINGSPWLVRVWNAALPLTHGLRLQMDAVMGAAARPLLAEAGALLLYPLVPGALGLWLVVRAR